MITTHMQKEKNRISFSSINENRIYKIILDVESNCIVSRVFTGFEQLTISSKTFSSEQRSSENPHPLLYLFNSVAISIGETFKPDAKRNNVTEGFCFIPDGFKSVKVYDTLKGYRNPDEPRVSIDDPKIITDYTSTVIDLSKVLILNISQVSKENNDYCIDIDWVYDEKCGIIACTEFMYENSKETDLWSFINASFKPVRNDISIGTKRR